MDYLKVEELAIQGKELNELYQEFGILIERFEVILKVKLSGYQEGDTEFKDLNKASDKIEELFMMALQSTQFEIEHEAKNELKR